MHLPIFQVKLISKGAEAELYLIDYQGKRAVLKRRIAKKYRHPQLDVYLRRMRTRREARNLRRAKEAGVKTPAVFHVNEEKFEIVMEFVEGERLKEYLWAEKPWRDVLYEVGKNIACMHGIDLIHGDLTTSNILVTEDGPCFLDFGLGGISRDVEDKAVDLVCFERSFTATHPELYPDGWKCILEGYAEYELAAEVLRRAEEVKRRARYL